MPYLPRTHFLLEGKEAEVGPSRAVILPVPFERTTSYGKGTAAGPDAVLRASHALELYDEELGFEPAREGIATLPPFLPEAFDLARALDEIQGEARTVLEEGKFLVTVGGEHSLTLATARAAAVRGGGGAGSVGVVQFDAHADLRGSYEGTPYSHASVMRRLVEDGFPTLAVGVRSLSEPEAELIRERGLPVIWGSELDRDPAGSRERFAEELERLPETVYLTFDLDFFDPSLVPATGTPEPGGGTWWPTLELLRRLFETKEVVAADVVELAPIGGQPASDFLAAKLIYKMIGYHTRRGG